MSSFDETDKQSAEEIARQEAEQNRIAAEIAELSQLGYQYLKENLLESAEENFHKILEYEPDNNYALVGLGDSARKRGDYRAAIEFYQKCLEHHPDNNYALFGLADCYKSLKHFNHAIKIWERYLHHDDRNVTVLTRVADAYRKVKDFKRSEELYRRVLEMEEDNPYALIGLGHLNYDFKNYEQALHYWGRMYDKKGDQVDIRVLTSMGNCHRKMKTFADGVEYFEKALEKEPKNFYALFGLADCYRGLGDQEKSLTYWNRILQKEPTNKVILTRAGDAYRNMGDLEHAEEYYKAALNIEFDTYAILGLALISKQHGRYREAIQSLESLVQQDPKNHRLYMEIADCYLKLGDKSKALEVLGEVQKQGIRSRHVFEMAERIKHSVSS